MKYLAIAILGFLLFFTSCKSKVYTPDTYEKEQITFGNGGGFTGAEVEYTLLSNGQMFKKSGDNYVQIAKLKKNTASQIFSNYEVLKMDKRIMNDPGNMYYFIKRKTAKTFHKAVWGGSNIKDKRLKIYFANLMKLVKDQNNQKTSNK